MLKTALAALIVLCIAMAPVHAADGPDGFTYANLDFEVDEDNDGWPDGWVDESDGHASRVEILNGDHVMRLVGDGEMRAVSQVSPIPAGVRSIDVAAQAKLTGYRKGENAWDNVRIALVFLDAAGEGITYPMGIGIDGDRDWGQVAATVRVPENAASARLQVLMHGSYGTLLVDDLIVVDTAAGESRVDTAGWIEYGADTLTTEGTIADLSWLNDSPAGVHGYLHVKDGGFYFEDGTGPFRFWGVAMAGGATLPDAERAEQVAARLAAMGVNCVRFHHLENTWSGDNTLIDYSARTDSGRPTSRVLNRENLDKLHYFWAELKKRGIYVYLDLITSRQWQEGDGVPLYRPGERGMDWKATIGHPAVRELIKEFNRKILSTPNPHTGLAPLEDPAFILSEVVNEDELAMDGRWQGDVGPYGRYYRQRWNAWLKERYGDPVEIISAWRVPGEESPLLEGEDPDDLTLAHSYGLTTWNRVPYERYEPGAERRRFMRRDEDRLRFWDDLQREAWQEIIDHARNLGYEVPFTGSNMPDTHLHSRWANIQIGRWLDEHAYFDLGGWTSWRNTPIRNVNELTVPPAALGLKAMLAPADYPFTLSEWNTPNDIDTAYVHVPHHAYRMAFHGWSGGNQFAFGWGTPPERSGALDIEQHAGLIGQWPVAGLMFRRGDLQVGEEKLVEFPARLIFDFDYHGGGSGQPRPWRDIDPKLSVVENIKTRFVEDPGAEVVMPELDAGLIDRENGLMVSSTGQMLWDYRHGAMFINTPRTVWAAGEFGGTVQTLGPVTVEMATGGASVAVTSLDGERPITDADRLLIMAVGRAYATGAVYNITRTIVKEHGALPLVTEPVVAALTIELSGATSAKVTAYNPDGSEAGDPPQSFGAGVLSVELGREPARGIYYGVTVER
jgi:hypothetical protein